MHSFIKQLTLAVRTMASARKIEVSRNDAAAFLDWHTGKMVELQTAVTANDQKDKMIAVLEEQIKKLKNAEPAAV